MPAGCGAQRLRSEFGQPTQPRPMSEHVTTVRAMDGLLTKLGAVLTGPPDGRQRGLTCCGRRSMPTTTPRGASLRTTSLTRRGDLDAEVGWDGHRADRGGTHLRRRTAGDPPDAIGGRIPAVAAPQPRRRLSASGQFTGPQISCGRAGSSTSRSMAPPIPRIRRGSVRRRRNPAAKIASDDRT